MLSANCQIITKFITAKIQSKLSFIVAAVDLTLFTVAGISEM